MKIEHSPVSDWTTDFDHLDPVWVKDPYPIWDQLRQECPMAYTERYTGAYLPTRYEDIKVIAYDTKNFTSSTATGLRVERPDPPVPSPPLSLDPPHHRASRMALMPLFTPKAVERFEPEITAICDRLIDRFIDKGHCDVAKDYAQEITSRVIARFFGVSEDMGPQFRDWIYEYMEIGLVDSEIYARATLEIDEYFVGKVRERRNRPGDDLISFLVQSEVDGKKMSDKEIVATLRLLMVAGIGTTWSVIGASLWHLSRNSDDLARLVAEADLLPTAIEEFLRAYAPASLTREVVRDVEVNGCPMAAGKMVLLSFPAGNRDPAAFPEPDRVMLDRQHNKHLAFGIGIHRCLGSNLARLEIHVALRRFLARIPKFRADPDKPVTWAASHIRGLRTASIIFEAC